MAVGKIKIDLEASTARFEQQMKTFRSKLDGSVKQIVKGLKIIGVAATAAGVGLSVLTKKAIDTNDQLAKLSTKLSISTEDLSALKYAADFSGASLGNLDGALSALTRRFNNFDKTGGGAAKDSMLELGIATRDSEGNLRKINNVFLEIAEKVSKMEAGIRKTAIVQDLFSKSQAKIIPLLNEGKEGLARFKREAESLGLILSQKTAKASEKFNDQLTILEKQSEGFGARLAEKLLPTLNNVVEEFGKMITKGEGLETVLNGIHGIFKGLVAVGVTLSTTFSLIAGNVTAFAEAVGLLSEGEFTKAFDTMSRRLSEIPKEIKEGIDQYKRLTGMKVDAEFTINKKGTPSKDESAVSPNSVNAEQIKVQLTEAQKHFQDYYKNLTNYQLQYANVVTGAFQGMEDALVSFVRTGKLDFKSLADSIISDLIRIAVRKAIVAPMAGAMMSGLGSMFGGAGAGGGGFGGFFAKGGRPDANKVSVIGEKGPELFVPDTAGRVIPNNKLGQGSSGAGGNVNQSEVNININAMDTQTGVAFLLSQKDTIKGIFNSDLNTNGVIRANL